MRFASFKSLHCFLLAFMRSCSIVMETTSTLPVWLKQRAVIEFLVAEGCTQKQIHSRLQIVYGNETIDVSNVCRWVASAKNVNRGLLPILDKSRSGCPKTAVTDANIQRVNELIRTNRRTTRDEIAAYLDISHERLNHIRHRTSPCVRKFNVTKSTGKVCSV